MDQKIYSGNGSYENILGILKKLGTKRLLLVCGNSFDKQEISKEIMNLPVEIIKFSRITPNPKYEEVCEGLKVFKKNNCDTILAIGGGSYLDVAKCIKLFCRMPDSKNYIKEEKVDTGVPIIAVPTTAGTGSESTQHSVIYYNGVKQSISHLSIIPEYVVLEPSLLKTLPKLQRKCSMLDALCHAVESYWAVKANDESKFYARQAIQMVLQYKDAYLTNTNKGNAKMLAAANFAGKAISITATTAGHAMSYKLTSLYDIPHGYACALCLTEVWSYLNEHIDNCIHPNGEVYLVKTLEEIAELFGAGKDINKAAEVFAKMVRELNLLEVRTNSMDEINVLTKSVNPERLSNFPITMTPDAIEQLYIKLIYRGKQDES